MISHEDRERIASAIRAAEAKTSGEIVCVLAGASSEATGLPVFIAAIVALALPWVLIAFTEFTVFRILILQILTFLIVAAVLCLPTIRTKLMPHRARRRVAHRAAMEQFRIHGIARKKERNGVLIFVSLAERYARIVADEGIAAKVHASDWQEAIDALIGHMRGGHVAEGFVAAIDSCGNVLSKHYPHTQDSRDRLPNKIYLV
ncbi:MAG TPA: TPM domain-containing protein [Methylovirgula sp.]